MYTKRWNFRHQPVNYSVLCYLGYFGAVLYYPTYLCATFAVSCAIIAREHADVRTLYVIRQQTEFVTSPNSVSNYICAAITSGCTLDT